MATAEATSTEKTALSKKVSRMLGLGLHSWEQLMLLSLGAAGLIAIAVFITTASVVILTRRESAETKAEYETYKLTVDGKVADAKKEGIKAGETAGNALLRSAELEKEAAAAKLETERLKATVAWRSAPPEAAAALEKILSAKPGSVNMRYTDGDPEALFLAIQLSQVLAKSKWQIAPGALKIGNSLTFGFVLPDGDSADGQTLREAFTSAKIPFSTQLPQSNMVGGFNISTIPNAPTLMVGSKAPPQFPGR